MYEVVMNIEGREYVFGIYENRNKANEVAIRVRDERGVDVAVYEVEDS